MDQERWTTIKEIVEAALEFSAGQRPAFIDHRCGTDVELRNEVEGLLAVSTSQADWFEGLRLGPESLRDIALSTGDTFEGYVIRRKLAEGGMAKVYLAYDETNKREVALKIVPRRKTRFSPREHQLLARLNHPNIALLHASGDTDVGFRYLVMEYVEGVAVTEFAASQGLSLRERLALFRKICGALQHAHQKFIIHRDLKPSNILVTGNGEPKLLDFGIAKELPSGFEAATVTSHQHRPMTYAFASPEQLNGESTDATTDVYQLGVILCMLLTGRLPYPVQSLLDLPLAIRSLEPSAPSEILANSRSNQYPAPGAGELNPVQNSEKLTGDLDAIALKALRKEPSERYQSVEKLSEDVRRYLDDEPVTARVGTHRYRVKKFLKRYRKLVLVASGVISILSVLVVALGLSLLETQKQRDRALAHARRGQAVANFLTSLFEQSDPENGGGPDLLARDILERAAERIADEFTSDRGVQALLLAIIGKTHTSLGLFDQAESLLRQALEIREERYGELHESVAVTLLHLGKLYTNLGRFEEAEHSISRALRIQQEILSEDDLNLSTTHNNLGTLFVRLGRYNEALQHYEESLGIRHKLLEPPHSSLASSYNNLATLYNLTGRYEEAEDLHRKTLAMRIELFGDKHDKVAASKNNLSRVLDNQGRLQEPLRLKREALHLRRQILPAQHKNLGKSINNLGAALRRLGDLDKAEALHLEALDLRTSALGEEHPDVAESLGNLARVYIDRDALDDADPLLARALEIKEKSYGSDHPSVGGTLAIQARLFRARKEYSAAEMLIRRALSIEAKRPAHFSRINYLQLLSLILLEQGQVLEAQDELDTAEGLAHDLLDIDHYYNAVLLSTSARIHINKGEPLMAVQELESALSTLRALFPEGHAWVVEADVSLGLARAQL